MTPARLVFACAALLAACTDSATPPAPRAQEGSWQPAWAPVDEAPIRPGVRIGPSGCTAGFLFVDPQTQKYYLSTAGHCIDGSAGIDGLGTRVSVDPVGEVGTTVFDSEGDSVNEYGLDGEFRIDFALIELDPDLNLQANPQVFGLDGPLVQATGPTGFLACGGYATGDEFAWHGYSQGFDEVGEPARARKGYLSFCSDGDTTAFGVGPAYRGDSGAAALHVTSGAAVGILIGQGSQLAMTSMPFIFEELAKTPFRDLRLATIDGAFAGPAGTP